MVAVTETSRQGVQDQKGQALLEFTLVLPFLILLLAVLLDLGLMINEYLNLSNVAQAGTRLAQQTLDLESEDMFGNPPNYISKFQFTPPSTCVPFSLNYIVPPPAIPAGQKKVHDRVINVLCVHQTRGQLRFLKRDGAGPDIQIEVSRRLPGFGGDEQDTVSVELLAKYESFLPFFSGLEIKTKASAPYLY